MGKKRERQTRGTHGARPAQEEELDLEEFSELLKPAGLMIRDVSRDGNCFFRAVSDQLYGSEQFHGKLRRMACDYMQKHPEAYAMFVDEEKDFESYVEEMRSGGKWAGNIELQACSMACDVNIRVHQSTRPSYDIRNHKGKNADVIHVSYHFNEHYASVRPLKTADLPVPAQHAPLPVPSLQVRAEEAAVESVRRSSSSRRPRSVRPRDPDDILTCVWRRVERGHKDVGVLVDKAIRTAKAIRISKRAPTDTDTRNDLAKRIEREMELAREKMESIAHVISDGTKRHLDRISRGRHDDSSRDSTDDELYRERVYKDTDDIFEALSNAELAVKAALQSMAEHTGVNKSGHLSKKRQQEAKRKERKDRRRREQELQAREQSNHASSQTGRTDRADIDI